MKAFVIRGPGQDTIDLTDVPVPSIGPEDLLVRVRAVGVGIHDSYFLPSGISYPFPIGIEAAGVIEEVGDALTGYSPGDRIAFVSSMQPKGGTWAEYAAVRTDSLIVPVPEGMTFEQAAAVPVAGNTALRAFHSMPAFHPGGALFMAGASGAIGTFAIQMARSRGWEVAASASRRNHDYLVSLGANLTVDYHDDTWPEEVRQWRPEGVDGALAIQPHTTATSLGVVRAGGTVVSISGDEVAPARGVRVAGLSYEVDVRDELVAMMDKIVAGELRLVTEQVYAFEDAPEALAKVQTRRARGKLVLLLS